MKIIAELCQNHNGDFDTVRRMVDAAAESGASHVKIQHIYVRNLVYRPEFEEGLDQDGVTKVIRRPWRLEYDRLKGLELSEDECAQFVEYVKSVGLVPMTTCFARGDVEKIAQQGFRTVKVASYDCASFPMLRELAARFDYLGAAGNGRHGRNHAITRDQRMVREADLISKLPQPANAVKVHRL